MKVEIKQWENSSPGRVTVFNDDGSVYLDIIVEDRGSLRMTPTYWQVIPYDTLRQAMTCLLDKVYKTLQRLYAESRPVRE